MWKILQYLILLLAILCSMVSAAPFTPAVFLVILLLPLSGLIARFGNIYIAVLSFLFCALAVIASPIVGQWRQHPGPSTIILSCFIVIGLVIFYFAKKYRNRHENDSADAHDQ